MTDTSKAARIARRRQRRRVIRTGRQVAHQMILAGEFDDMASREPTRRLTERTER